MSEKEGGTVDEQDINELIPLAEALTVTTAPLPLTPDPMSSESHKNLILHERSVEGVKRYIEDGKCRNIIVMAGAGISTSAGIPDFRSPSCGLYAKIQEKYKLKDPQLMFEIGYFKKHPEPFFSLAKDLLPEGFKPTPSHHFVRLLHDKGLLLRHYTQNVDGLERKTGIPDDKIVEAHGSFHLSHCTACNKEFPFVWMQEQIRNEVVPMCACGGLIKPDIIFFGESLPSRFFQCVLQDFVNCDLLIIIGTSLIVQPFASLIEKVRSNCPRLLINREKVGTSEESYLAKLIKRFTPEKDIDKNSLFGSLMYKEGLNFQDSLNRDVALLGDCDDIVKVFAEAMGWSLDLERIMKG